MKKDNIYTLDQITNYLNQKYDDQFTVTGTDLQPWNSRRSRFSFYSQRLQTQISVSYVPNDDISLAIRDNYMSIFLRHDVASCMQLIADKVYENVKVVCDPLNNPMRMSTTAETTAEELLINRADKSKIVLFLNEDVSTREEDAELLRQKMAEHNYVASLIIIYLKDERDYEQITDDNFEDYLRDDTKWSVKCDILIGNDGNYVYADWSDVL